MSIKQHNVVVLEIKDIRKELLLTEAILSLVEHSQELNSILNADEDQIIAVLANNKLYTSAAKLAKRLNKNIAPVLDSLAIACVRAGEENSTSAWTWIRENDLAGKHTERHK